VTLRRTAAIVVVSLAATLGIWAHGAIGRGGEPPPAGPGVQLIEASLPSTHLFGDRIEADLSLAVDRRLTDPRTVTVHASFTPYESIGKAGRAVESVGQTTVLGFRFPLQCLAAACAPRAPSRRIDLQPARVRYVQQGHPRSFSVRWPPVTTASRLSRQDLQQPAFRASTSRLPAVAYRVHPRLLAWAAAVAAGVLAFVAAALLAGVLPQRATVSSGGPETVLDPLEAALRRAEEATDEVERRAALASVADELASTDLAPLDERARRLAWSERPPAPDEARAFAGEVREQREVRA
jgi:hypothetical protein